MIIKEKNPIYALVFNGGILKYQATSLSGIFFRILGISRHLEISVNTVLGYKASESFLGFTRVTLTINRYRFGVDEPNPRVLTPILTRTNSFEQLEMAIAEVTALSKVGKNIGLSHLSQGCIQKFYEDKESSELDRATTSGKSTSALGTKSIASPA